MSRWGDVNFQQLEQLREKVELLEKADKQRFIESVSKHLAARLIQLCQGDTPVGDSYENHVGGTLRAGWTAKSEAEAEKLAPGMINPVQYAKTLPVERSGSTYTIKVINPVHYASYVEYGHRQLPGRYVPAIKKRLKKAWVEGLFMLTTSEMRLEGELVSIIEKKLTTFLKDKL